MEISGLIPATATPFNSDGSIDFADLARHVHLVASSTDDLFGIAVNGHAGEILTLTSAERAQVVAAARQALPRHLKLVAGIEGYTAEALVREGINAREAGADALLVLPPFDVRPHRRLAQNPDAVYAIFSELDRHVGLPMIVFQYPEHSGCQYSIEAMLRIAELPNVVAVKNATGEVTRYTAFYDALHDKIAVLAACDAPPLLGMLLHGAAGALIGISVVGTPIWAEMVREATTGSAQRAKEIFNSACLPLTEAIFENQEPKGFISAFAATKEALVQLGQMRSSWVRPPAIGPDEARKAQIGRALAAAGLLSEVRR